MGISRTISSLAKQLRERARVGPKEVQVYLSKNPAEWQQIARQDAPDAADIIEEVQEDSALNLLKRLDREDASEVLEEVRPEVLAELLEHVPPTDAATLLSRMNAESAADVLGELDEERRKQVLDSLPQGLRRDVAALLVYEKDTAGGMMTTELATFAPDVLVSDTVAALRRSREQVEALDAVFVVGAEGQLLGTVPLRELLLSSPEARLSDIMASELPSLPPEADRERAIELALRYNLDVIPVAGEGGRLLGALSLSAVLEAIQTEGTEDFAVASGTGAEESVFTRASRSVRMRLPWLLANLLLALGVVFAVERQKGIIDEHAVLAALMPLVAQVGGNGGAQSLAVVLRGLAMDAISPHRTLKVLWRQLRVGLLNGVAVGVAAAGVGTVIGGARPGLAVGLAALVNLSIGSLAGAGIPMLLRRLGLDPALASNIFLTLLTDLVGFGGFLVIATVLL